MTTCDIPDNHIETDTFWLARRFFIYIRGRIFHSVEEIGNQLHCVCGWVETEVKHFFIPIRLHCSYTVFGWYEINHYRTIKVNQSLL